MSALRRYRTLARASLVSAFRPRRPPPDTRFGLTLGSTSHRAEWKALEANQQSQSRGDENHRQRRSRKNIAAIRESEDGDRQRHPAWRIDHDRRPELSHRQGEAQAEGGD